MQNDTELYPEHQCPVFRKVVRFYTVKDNDILNPNQVIS